MSYSTALQWHDEAMDCALEEVLDATRGETEAAGLRFSCVRIDSRAVVPGALFFALRGRRHDGHAFVRDALARGAEAAVVETVPAGVPAARLIVVADTLRALGDLAAWKRRRAVGLRVAAVTGSNGKTTTKEMLAAVFRHAFGESEVVKTPGNRNNLIGLPMVLLEARGDERVAVLELGMNAPGEIGRLAEIADPEVGVITNVGPAHLEGVGSLEGVAAAKGELLDVLGAGRTAVLNADDPMVMSQAGRIGGTCITFGRAGDVRAEAVDPRGLDGTDFDLIVPAGRIRVRLPLPGAHNVMNALAAAAAAHAMGVSPREIAEGLAQVEAPAMRMAVRRLTNGVTLVNDGYNANPGSMAASLRAVTENAGGRVLAVLGEMRELGAQSEALHFAAGMEAAALGVRVVIALRAPALAEGARAGGAAEVVEVDTPEEAAAAVAARWAAGDTLFLKGSRGDDDEEAVRRSGSRMGEVARLLAQRAES